MRAIFGYLGPSWGHVGAMLGHLGGMLGVCWGHVGPWWATLGHFGPCGGHVELCGGDVGCWTMLGDGSHVEALLDGPASTQDEAQTRFFPLPC